MPMVGTVTHTDMHTNSEYGKRCVGYRRPEGLQFFRPQKS